MRHDIKMNLPTTSWVTMPHNGHQLSDIEHDDRVFVEISKVLQRYGEPPVHVDSKHRKYGNAAQASHPAAYARQH